jgi:hypothetical protein
MVAAFKRGDSGRHRPLRQTISAGPGGPIHREKQPGPCRKKSGAPPVSGRRPAVSLWGEPSDTGATLGAAIPARNCRAPTVPAPGRSRPGWGNDRAQRPPGVGGVRFPPGPRLGPGTDGPGVGASPPETRSATATDGYVKRAAAGPPAEREWGRRERARRGAIRRAARHRTMGAAARPSRKAPPPLSKREGGPGGAGGLIAPRPAASSLRLVVRSASSPPGGLAPLPGHRGLAVGAGGPMHGAASPGPARPAFQRWRRYRGVPLTEAAPPLPPAQRARAAGFPPGARSRFAGERETNRCSPAGPAPSSRSVPMRPCP